MSFIDDLVVAQEMGHGAYLKPTTESTLILERIRSKPGGYKGHSIVFEFYVAATKDPNADPVGSHVSEVFLLKAGDKVKNETKIKAMKSLVVALGLDEADLRKAMTDAEGEGQLARGLSLKVTAWQGESFVMKKWMRITHPDPAKAMSEGRAILDGVPF